jgi:hypothetical protein
MDRMKCTVAVVLMAGLLLATPALCQTGRTAVVAGPAAVLDVPSGDGHVLGQLPMGIVVQLVDRFHEWYLVTAPAMGGATLRGWIQSSVLELPKGVKSAASGTGRYMVRAFGRAGGTLFTASDTFETILGGRVNSVYGGGGQVVLPNGLFFEASVDRFRHDGTLALGAGEQVFRLDTPTRVTLTPIQITGGYRVEKSNRIASYFGGGAGWYTLEEDTPFAAGAAPVRKRSPGYHVLGGAEVNVLRFMWLAGELQWAAVPKGIGETGVSAIFKEKDLGGTTFRVKVMVGY